MRGGLMPEGLEYVSRWVDRDFTPCFQLMKTENEKLFEQEVNRWKDLVDVESIPVQTSAEAMQAIAPRL
jgi:Domain of unknown function (DUF3303)